MFGGLLFGLAIFVWLPAAFAQQRMEQLRLEAGTTDKLRAQQKFKEAEVYLQGLIKKYRDSGDPQAQYFFTSNLVEIYLQQELTPEALQTAEQAVQGCVRYWGPKHGITGSAMVRLARVYADLNRFDDANRVFVQAREINTASYGADDQLVVTIDSHVANNLAHAGRFQEAETLRMRVLAWEQRQSQGRPTEGIAIELANLGNLYFKQARHMDARRVLLEANDVFIQSGSEVSLHRAKVLKILGDVCQAELQYDDAEKYYQQSHELYAKLLGPQHPLTLVQTNLADLYASMKRYDKAEALLNESLLVASKYYGPDSSQVYDAKDALLNLYLQQEKYEAAEKLAAQLQLWAESPQIPRRVLQIALAKRALAARRLPGRLDDVCRFDAQIVELQEEERATISGGEQQRSTSMSVAYYNYSLAAADHLRNDKFAEGFAFSELGRSRTLLDQMALAQVDLFAGMPRERANHLRATYDQMQNQTSELEQRVTALAEQTDLSDANKRAQLAQLGAELQAARKRQSEAYSFIRNESPTFRRVVGQEFTGTTLAELRAYLKQEEALLLYYIAAPSETFLMALNGEEGLFGGLLDLQDTEPAHLLGVEPGTLVGSSQLGSLLVNAAHSGAVQLLSKPGSDYVAKLAALRKLLIRDSVMQEIQSGKYRRLIIVPDGPLALLPFEALVVEVGSEPKLLLDVAPPISYAPSATVLLTLERRPAVEIPADRDPVLAVGDPAYQSPQSSPASKLAAIDRDFRSRGGHLARLPYSGLEANWVAKTFAAHGMKAGVLRQDSATEAAVRKYASNRRIIHLACHGLADDELDNFFGALALTPGNTLQTDSRNDGFLTLSELYELDLRACELAILSACQTNYGPQHNGEGAWAISRSFLVAGSRRVIASNWLVDDKAGASLISYFCGALVKQPAAESDYSQALRDAKLWARSQAEWQHPYYWATFVLVGPR